jgi:hypothetical protein
VETVGVDRRRVEKKTKDKGGRRRQETKKDEGGRRRQETLLYGKEGDRRHCCMEGRETSSLLYGRHMM